MDVFRESYGEVCRIDGKVLFCIERITFEKTFSSLPKSPDNNQSFFHIHPKMFHVKHFNGCVRPRPV